MRIFAYALRPYDEPPCLEALSRELGFEYGWTADYPTQENAVLVNAARGSLVDTAALFDALESGRLGAAALDTIEREAGLYYLNRSRDVLPNRDRAALMALPNVIVTPHMAFYTAESVEGMVRSNVEALLAFAAGAETPYEVR